MSFCENLDFFRNGNIWEWYDRKRKIKLNY